MSLKELAESVVKIEETTELWKNNERHFTDIRRYKRELVKDYLEYFESMELFSRESILKYGILIGELLEDSQEELRLSIHSQYLYGEMISDIGTMVINEIEEIEYNIKNGNEEESMLKTWKELEERMNI